MTSTQTPSVPPAATEIITPDVVDASEDTSPHHMRITSHGKIRSFVKFALNFIEVNALLAVVVSLVVLTGESY